MRRIADWPVGARLATGMATVVALLGIVSLVGLSGADKEATAAQHLVDGQRLTRDAGQVKYRAADLNGWQTAYAFDIDRLGVRAARDSAPSRAAFLASAQAFVRELRAAQRDAMDDKDRQNLAAVGRRYAAFMALDRRIIELYRRGDARATARATGLVLGSEIVRFQALSKAVDTALADMNADSAQRDQEATAARASARRTIVTATLLAILLAAGITVLLTRSVTRPLAVLGRRMEELDGQDLAALEASLDRLAQGDLTFEAAATVPPVPDPRRDELGRAQATLNALIGKVAACVRALGSSRDNLAGMLGEVSTTAASVSSASQQVAATAEEAGRATTEIADAVGDVARGAERQVDMVASARRSAEEVAVAATRSADEARRSAEAATRATDMAQRGAGAVGEAMRAMGGVREAATAADERIRLLGERSAAIGGIVDTITTIAEQTNLLALNAAIEAARAGEQGRGFAVVADEVRKLAEESRQAAHSIAELVTEVQHETQEAVVAVERGARETATTEQTVEEARDAFGAIAAAVEEVTGLVRAISEAVSDVSADAERMETQMGEVASVAAQSSASTEEVSASTEQTSASTQEIAASAQELADSARQLDELVGRFRLGA